MSRVCKSRRPRLGIHKTTIQIFDGTPVTKGIDIPFIWNKVRRIVRLQNPFTGGFPLNVTV